MIASITEDIARLSLTASFPAIAAILAGATADYLNTISGGLNEYAGGAFAYLLSDIMKKLEEGTPDKIFDLIGNTGNGLLAIADVLLNAETEVKLAAAYYTAVELNDEVGKYIDTIREIQDIAKQIRDQIFLIDAPVQYKVFVKEDMLEALGVLDTVNNSLRKVISSPGSIRPEDIEIIRDQLEIITDKLCVRPMNGPKERFPNIESILGTDWEQAWEGFKEKFTNVFKLLKDLAEKIIELDLIAAKIELLIGILLDIDLEEKQQPFYTTYKKALLKKILEMKDSLEEDIANTDITESLFKWPEWCTEALSIKTMFNTAFPERDKIIETIYEARAKRNQILLAQENLAKCNNIAVTTFNNRLISLRMYSGYALGNGLNDIQRGFVNNILHNLNEEADRLIQNARCIQAAINPILCPPYESTLFVALRTIFESLGADVGLEMLKKGQVQELKDAIAKWSATGGLSLTLAGQMVSCITPLLINANISPDELDAVSQLLESGMEQARKLKVSVPLPNIDLPFDINPKAFLKYKEKLENQMKEFKQMQDALNSLMSKVQSDIYNCV